MIYRYVRFILGICLMIYVGRIIVKGIENLPKSGSYIIVAPHHHFIDAIVFATQIRATDFFFIAKKELFKNKIFSWFLGKLNAFPVDRKNPSLATLQFPIKKLTENQQSFVIFPTGSRYSSQLKSGYLLIAKSSKKPIVPAKFEFNSWGRSRLTIGKPYFIASDERLSKKEKKILNEELELKFAAL
ncbi:lysophospholipid acyltransferase family protein [Ligilactobacillus acidipiscis]|uniref:1-acyl-sn-glycerol-3-phosphate acyltransferase n=3 Tax=Ligilactobacillus acidipiscis TaxID=89059 RepID=A0A1K1KPD3_9LACO|nr:1-acyl-sn-glycerol-3-phosphate acyltransferase [Ligilactobacillus acidipiscis]GAW64756.1 1-acyl-sn-glycerol-3-phosphate acyltransferase [Ligilactobacillus acidipiscis]GEN19951.1 1-acyl-sn-glycerol-3-phosphate acyltransferase [Ligilactobacillus acidipiscis]SFV40732.1 1-acyl-sn-glycerol-3-phosphate acyltransferase [Ligilactobacillus acidipiscis]HJE96533.1 1-acyl-sn-glycerol-3-phosphate acyltransferase [Ligilactobacillus acidipiscis]